jgi:hypothetical protein
MTRHCQTVSASVRCTETANCESCREDIAERSAIIQSDMNVVRTATCIDAHRLARKQMADRMRAPEQTDLL